MPADAAPDVLERLVCAYGETCRAVGQLPPGTPQHRLAVALRADAYAAFMTYCRDHIEPDPAISIATPTPRALRRYVARPEPEGGDG